MNEELLKKEIQDAELHPLLLLTIEVLGWLGYSNFEVMDRRLPKQKSRHGGFELLCTQDFGHKPILVPVKVLRDSARTRMVSEMVATLDRLHMERGLLIFTKHIPPKVRNYLNSIERNRVIAVDGDALAHFLQFFGIGVKQDSFVDYTYFRELKERSDRILASLTPKKRR